MSGRLRKTAIVAAAALTLGVFFAVPARADTAVYEGFEGNPYEQWTTRDTPGDSLVWLGDHTQARTGTHAAQLWAPFDVPARAYRTITVDRPIGGPVTCYGEAYLKRAPTLRGMPGTDKQPLVRIFIKDGGAFGTVVLGGNTYDLANFEYGRAAFATFAYRNPVMTVEISVTGGLAYVDDLSVRCLLDPR
ncbi:hypothetical protein [Paractinoplanes rishiriensis]|uniref:Uncharacterized protein n=1 Tax=Paractinoplanes rishiriensis TaxID=1050105 RepID=A0A919JZT8_9ACTN|nr:hypothetical protein [Actinoplanes rishiriensis]GIE97723.1 hypothetical protein Ari01nite_51880 [Actinoplanes rishiriensis]